MRTLFAIVVLACVAVAAFGLSPDHAPMMRFARAGSCKYTSSELVVANGGSADIKPALKTCPLFPPMILTCQSYLSAASCLSAAGPLGAMGPLAALGPIGKNFWNPSTVMDAARDYEAFQSANKVAESPANPLSDAGPLGAAYNGAAFRQSKGNDFVLHLDALGLFSVLGPLGPLGPLGVLGPLGPNGIHKFSRKQNGEYTKAVAVQRKFEAAWNGSSKKTWPLFEMYDKTSTARSTANQDTSFGAYGSLSASPLTSSKDFVDFTSGEAQFVTIAAVPENVLDALSLTIYSIDKQGGNVKSTLLKTGSMYYIPWAQIQVPAGTALRAEVTLAFSSRAMLMPVSIPFRIYVVGSTSLINNTPVSGPHVKTGSC